MLKSADDPIFGYYFQYFVNNMRFCHFFQKWVRFLPSALEITHPYKFWVNLVKVEFFVKFDPKFWSKKCDFGDFHQFDSKFVGECNFVRWSRIFDSFLPNLTVSQVIGQILQKVSENQVISIFVHRANEPGLTGSTNLRSILIQSGPQKFKLITQIATAVVILTEKSEKL